MMNPRDIHIPVMLERCLELLGPALQAPGSVYVDGTLGMGGHAEAILSRYDNAQLVGMDRDPQALAIARERLAAFAGRTTLVHTVYDGIAGALAQAGVPRSHAVLYDLGVSSLQLDEADRGFAYAKDAPLDMRMNQSDGITAADVIASYGEGDLRRIFERYGEEKLSGRYARAIIAARQTAPLTRTGELVDVLQDATPAALKNQGHPAKRVFQALRIEVNGELAALESAIPAALNTLAVGGRLVILSYQSLEDRFIKRLFAEATRSTAPAGLPVEMPEHRPRFRLLVKGAELASADEAERNPRAKPVRLRAIERVRERE
ncbi:16S rRNA (cytosine1402-N4)-methyltransferase [Microbacterium amylolyticum]|uniref:Ribosomal RNA small subunit methyltransferase H n=2 Tax=Microbacterium amylolyticum TaxID=936337 RepID=A0ABS4ZFE3_9MICO|nr:16S rRNA (cytosine1402-N4)-methyltransferase [Microbacterium amylolyticum]